MTPSSAYFSMLIIWLYFYLVCSSVLFQVSGLSKFIGQSLNFFDGWPAWGVVICLSTITSLLTEVTSNTAISTIFLPITARMVNDLTVTPFCMLRRQLPVIFLSSEISNTGFLPW